MPKALDITGEKYGRLTAISNTGKKNLRNFIWVFKCDCGNQIEAASGEVRRGSIRSCGCLQKELATIRIKALQKVGTAASIKHGKTKTPTWVSWSSMRQRCSDENHKSYKDYGGRGIKVCERWLESFENFLADMGERPEGTSIDRINVDGDYMPENCRWASDVGQGNNRRNNRIINFEGQSLSVSEWARKYGISPKALTYRLNKGWSIEEALSMKINHGNRWVRGERKL